MAVCLSDTPAPGCGPGRQLRGCCCCCHLCCCSRRPRVSGAALLPVPVTAALSCTSSTPSPLASLALMGPSLPPARHAGRRRAPPPLRRPSKPPVQVGPHNRPLPLRPGRHAGPSPGHGAPAQSVRWRFTSGQRPPRSAYATPPSHAVLGGCAARLPRLACPPATLRRDGATLAPPGSPFTVPACTRSNEDNTADVFMIQQTYL